MPEHCDNVDVVVIGGGGAGLAAALAAVEFGARVRLIERLSSAGGTTAMSIGSVIAAGSRRQRMLTAADTPADHGRDLRSLLAPPAGNDQHSDELIELLVHEAGPTVDWLEDHGVSWVGPIAEHGHTHPRMHMLAPTPRAAMRALTETAATAGVDIRTGIRVTSVEPSRDGWLVGSTAAGPALRARAVVLATGDASAALSTSLRPPMNEGATGDARTIAATLRGRIVPRPHRAVAFRRIAWPHLEIRPVVFSLGMRLEDAPGTPLWPRQGVASVSSVDGDGGDEGYAAFVDELDDGYYFFVAEGDALMRLRAADDPVCTYPGLGFARWRDLLSAGEVAFHPGPSGMVARVGPFGVFTALTDGGVVVDGGLRVLSEGGTVIEGLFGAGAAGWGPLRLRGHGHHLAWAFTSGRLAGEAAGRHHRAA